MIPANNLMRLLPDAEPPTREALAGYFEACGDACLSHFGRRPLTLVRSVAGTTFFHKGPLPPIPAVLRTLEITKADGTRGTRIWVDDLRGLLALLDLDVVEVHPWNATVDDLERPDRLVFDLDPDAGVTWSGVTKGALALREFLLGKGLESWPKTTGGKGLHLIALIARERSWAEVRQVARALTQEFVATVPELYTAAAGTRARHGGKIFIDYLRNGRGQSAIAAMSPRARLGGLVSMPLTWAEVGDAVRPETFTLGAAAARCRTGSVPFGP